jgi:hypothetical protein
LVTVQAKEFENILKTIPDGFCIFQVTKNSDGENIFKLHYLNRSIKCLMDKTFKGDEQSVLEPDSEYLKFFGQKVFKFYDFEKNNSTEN